MALPEKAPKPGMRRDGSPKKDYPKPSGEMVTFYLGVPPQYKKGERLKLSINGYDYMVTFGQRNTAPSEIVALLKNCASRTSVPDLEKTDPSKRGVPRDSSQFFNPEMKVMEHFDYDVEVLPA